MVRKQVYIEERQDRLLKRRARQLGLTEAQLIREGIDALDRGALAGVRPRRLEALAESERYVREHRLLTVPQTGRGWTRDEPISTRSTRTSTSRR